MTIYVVDASVVAKWVIKEPAYDCLYLALALKERLQFVTADGRLVRKLHQSSDPSLKNIALLLNELT